MKTCLLMIQHVSMDCHHCRSKGNRNDYKCPHLIPDGSPLKHSGSLISVLLTVYSVGIYSVILVVSPHTVYTTVSSTPQTMDAVCYMCDKSIPEVSCLIGRYAVSLVLQSAMFWRAVVPSKHGEWNSNIAYHPKRPESQKCHISAVITENNPLTPNEQYSGRTAPLTSKVEFYIFIQEI